MPIDAMPKGMADSRAANAVALSRLPSSEESSAASFAAAVPEHDTSFCDQLLELSVTDKSLSITCCNAGRTKLTVYLIFCSKSARAPHR